MSTPLASRPFSPEDLPLVMDSWVESYRLSHWAGSAPMHLYRQWQRESVAWLLQRRPVVVTVAYDPEGASRADVYGWIAVERGVIAPMKVKEGSRWVMRPMPAGPVVHYCYVMEAYRRLGVAKYLFRAAGVDPRSAFFASHRTSIAHRLIKEHTPFCRFNPLLCRFPLEDAKEALVHEAQ